MIEKYNLQVEKFKKLSFKKSLVFILTSIFILQTIMFFNTIRYGFDNSNYPNSYYLISEIIGICGVITITTFSIIKLYKFDLSIADIINWSLIKSCHWLKETILYFLICCLFVIPISLLKATPEIQVGDGSNLIIVLSLFSMVFLAPFCEEIIFRGYLQSSMYTRFKRKNEIIVINAMLFAFVHVLVIEFILTVHFPYYIFFMGFFIAKLYDKYLSIIPCILLHALNNILVFFIDTYKFNLL